LKINKERFLEWEAELSRCQDILGNLEKEILFHKLQNEQNTEVFEDSRKIFVKKRKIAQSFKYY
jgi:flagellar biosynthesis chaperone FliJ